MPKIKKNRPDMNKIIQEFFEEFISYTDTRYMVWKEHPDIKAGGMAGRIIDFWVKQINKLI